MKKYILPLFFLLLFGCGQEITDRQSKETQPEADTSITPSATTYIAEIPELPLPDTTALKLQPQQIITPAGDTFQLWLPQGFKVAIAASGMRRIRFMDRSPEGRLFLTDMHTLADNSKGKVYVLDSFDSASHTFAKRNTYLSDLRNPNSLRFYQDSAGKMWLYLALTPQLLRYPYKPGDTVPSGKPEVLDTYPAYGLSYRYGGWHLTRTIEFAGNGKVYVSVGSSCNACVEKEEVRASVVEMNPDGSDRSVYASGLRNAVGLEWVEGSLFATNMGADHLGNDKPDDVLYRLQRGKNYGWPYCYPSGGQLISDPKFDAVPNRPACDTLPLPFASFGAHSAPLGLAWFPAAVHSPPLDNYFLVAQHGSYTSKIGRGYSIQRIRKAAPPEDFIKGFLDKKGKVHGRPCGIFISGPNAFFFTDDLNGIVYYVWKE